MIGDACPGKKRFRIATRHAHIPLEVTESLLGEVLLIQALSRDRSEEKDKCASHLCNTLHSTYGRLS